MKSIKINRIVAIGLLMVVVIEFGQATKPIWPLENETEHEIFLAGKAPKVGEVFEVIYRVRLKPDAPPRPEHKYYVKFSTGTYNPIEVITANEISIPYLIPGEWHEFRGRFRIPEPYGVIRLNARIRGEGGQYGLVGTHFGLRLIDSVVGQYSTGEEYEKSLSVVHRYDPVDGSFTCSPSQNPAPVEENRRIIKMIKVLEPRLSDSLALLFHSDQYRVGIPKGLPKWHEENKRWLEEEIFEYYLKDDWFEALRENRREEWLQEEKKKIESGRKEGRINFFRPDNNSNSGGANPPSDRINKDFYGQWWFKDHNYNKDQGLLATAVKRPIKNGKARLLMTYMYSSNYYRVLSNYDATDDSGYFHIIFDIPQGATGCKAYPVIYPSGPYPNVPMVMLSDPNIAQPDYWKDLNDPTLFIMRELGVPTYHDFYANAIPCSLGVIWTDTFPQSAQPQSGCINIYETYLHARTITPEEPGWQLRVMWEPGYDSTTKYKSTDTIFVYGDTTGNNDEWDDDILLHEFGHYLMHHYATLNQTSTSPHTWWNSYSDDTCLAYQEGWADFFSGRSREGTETDSLIVDTAEGIGSELAGYLNLENPWDYSANWNPVDSFEGGPWCEGAVAGALWDIYDPHNEIPYPSYPDSLNGVWFPDTALADSLTMDFDTIWTVFDDYNPPGEPTHCWTIFDFRSGWNSYNYGHQFALNQILLHHRIQDSIPAQPTGLGAELDNDYNVDLCWYKNSEPDLNGYRVFRRGKQTLGVSDWSSWGIIVENSSPTDTTHLDATVQGMYTYEYKVTAYDSIGNESEFSDSVRIDIPQKDQDKNSPPFVRNSVIKDIRQLELMVPEGSHVLIVKIYDCTGRVIDRQELTFEKGFSGSVNICNRRGKNLSSGVYFVDIQNDNDLRVVEKIVIIK